MGVQIVIEISTEKSTLEAWALLALGYPLLGAHALPGNKVCNPKAQRCQFDLHSFPGLMRCRLNQRAGRCGGVLCRQEPRTITQIQVRKARCWAQSS